MAHWSEWRGHYTCTAEHRRDERPRTGIGAVRRHMPEFILGRDRVAVHRFGSQADVGIRGAAVVPICSPSRNTRLAGHTRATMIAGNAPTQIDLVGGNRRGCEFEHHEGA